MIQEIIAARLAGLNQVRLGIMAAGLLAIVSANLVRADENWAGPFPAETLGSTREFFKDEAVRARKSVRFWGATGLASAAYAAAGWVHMIEPPAALAYMAYVLAAGGGIGAIQESYRRRHYLELATGILSETAPAGPGALWLRRPTADRARGELQSMRHSLKTMSQSGLRAGCVIPVLFSGIALYGLSAGTAQGEDLAGLAIGAALVMAVPSMLRYWSLKTRLDRVDGLINLWDRNLPTMEKANE